MLDILKRNHVNVIGSGEKIMMLAHGFGCDQTTWKFITDAFLKEYKLVLFDYVGSGNSDVNEYDFHKYSTLDGYASDIVEIIDTLDLKNIIFIGHSVSGMIGMLAAIQSPQIFEKLIFIGPSPRYLNDGDYIGGFEKQQIEDLFTAMATDYSLWAKNLAPAVMGNSDRPELTGYLQESFESMNPKIAQNFAKATFYSDYRDKLHLLKVPSLSLMTREDIIVPINIGNYITRQSPHHSTHLMSATGHYPHISNPEETIKAIKTYIDSSNPNQ